MGWVAAGHSVEGFIKSIETSTTKIASEPVRTPVTANSNLPVTQPVLILLRTETLDVKQSDTWNTTGRASTIHSTLPLFCTLKTGRMGSANPDILDWLIVVIDSSCDPEIEVTWSEVLTIRELQKHFLRQFPREL
jgi:hypothetical protein